MMRNKTGLNVDSGDSGADVSLYCLVEEMSLERGWASLRQANERLLQNLSRLFCSLFVRVLKWREIYYIYIYIYTSIYFRRFAEADVYLSSLCWRPELNTLSCLFAGWKRNFALGGFYLHSEAFFFVVFALDMQLYKYLLTACFSEETLQTGSLKEKRFKSEVLR